MMRSEGSARMSWMAAQSPARPAPRKPVASAHASNEKPPALPKDRAALEAITRVREYKRANPNDLEEIRFVLFSDEVQDAWRVAVRT